ncbi:sigma-54-dependent transcriptional regulator [Anoxynatronum buryatiense]|uniref:Stage 0 sporulation protein A homolog n=1 Tax=Anoxynatronum buryatiense TaxID=489973 RepID=A0AA45WT45_9CLOT|nr:sigma-54 dependent transcriptional regulator [Anoxynatronum buryatiense]SMP40583.1 DNA-binding transcriptional response regulator, NtrC family, contains REC, AAA-type ATPase, and a Fis-type DNA-binding domains [Anoxynatronum buryatiense]
MTKESIPKEKEQILVVDDSADTLEILERKLAGKGYQVYLANQVESALRILETTEIDLVITDYKMPRLTGLDLIRHIRERDQDLQIIMITGYPTVESAVEAVKSGAEEYLTKPFTDEEFFACLNRVMENVRNRKLARGKAAPDGSRYGIVAASEPMKEVFHAIDKSATNPVTVLVTGESGTGKELVARAIHYHSERAKAPFVPVNCGAIPENLLESELFGYMKGAFTGANETRAGFFITADGGTLFLDEIGETSLAMQVKLLRVMEDGMVMMVGSQHPRRVSVRLIAATNKNLRDLVKQGRFREDLYYRLNVINIQIPALRERGDDVVLLSNYFLQKCAGEIGRDVPVLSDEVLQIFKRYEWPGNVRELENLIQRLVIMVESSRVTQADLPAFMKGGISIAKGFERTLEQVEQEYIIDVLNYTGGNKTKAAVILGIDRKTLRRKIDGVADNDDGDNTL